MSDQEALMRAILVDPACNTARLVYADWLEENAGTIPCSACEKKPDEVNHPPGMTFVGWGHGWQPCTKCMGSATVPDGNAERAEFIRRSVDAGEVENGWYLQPHIHHNFKAAFVVRGLRPEQYFYRRGFVSSVRTTLAYWVGEEPCPDRVYGVQWRSMPPDSRVCESCGGDPKLRKPGTGRTPALGPRIVAEQPVERVEVSDKEPHYDNECGMYEFGRGNEFPSELPEEILSAMRLQTGQTSGHLFFHSEKSGIAALSLALVNWARREAGLPPLPVGFRE